MARRKKRTKFAFREHSYLAVLFALVVFLLAFAFLSPIGFNGDITGRTVEGMIATNPQITYLSFFALLFGILFLILFTHNLMQKVI